MVNSSDDEEEEKVNLVDPSELIRKQKLKELEAAKSAKNEDENSGNVVEGVIPLQESPKTAKKLATSKSTNSRKRKEKPVLEVKPLSTVDLEGEVAMDDENFETHFTENQSKSPENEKPVADSIETDNINKTPLFNKKLLKEKQNLLSERNKNVINLDPMSTNKQTPETASYRFSAFAKGKKKFQKNNTNRFFSVLTKPQMTIDENKENIENINLEILNEDSNSKLSSKYLRAQIEENARKSQFASSSNVKDSKRSKKANNKANNKNNQLLSTGKSLFIDSGTCNTRDGSNSLAHGNFGDDSNSRSGNTFKFGNSSTNFAFRQISSMTNQSDEFSNNNSRSRWGGGNSMSGTNSMSLMSERSGSRTSGQKKRKSDAELPELEKRHKAKAI